MNRQLWFIVIFASILFMMIVTDLQIIHNCILRGDRLFLGSNSFPGNQFMPLGPYLKGIRRAGYYSDAAPRNPDVNTAFMYTLQRAQFALVPTMLDHYTPFEYEYIVLYLKDPRSLEPILGSLNAKVILNLDKKVVLIRRES